MPLPGFQDVMLPLLELCADDQEWSVKLAKPLLVEKFGLSEDEQRELLPSGAAPKFANRVAWAKTYLEWAGLLERVRRGVFRITPQGREVLRSPPVSIDISFLSQFESFERVRNAGAPIKKADPLSKTTKETREDETPEEVLQAAYSKLNRELSSVLLEQIAEMSSGFFERLVLDLMLAMGYGGARENSGSVTDAGADGGIDGVINEDQLGLDAIYLQAKRWQHPVGRPEIHKFVGALHGKRARKGVFLTTSSFTREAIEYADAIETKVVLVDGVRLAELMIQYGIGCAASQTYVIKRLDSDYFVEE